MTVNTAVKLLSSVSFDPDECLALHQSSTGISPFGTLPVPPQMLSSLELIRTGFEAGLAPSLTEEGTSGSYMLKEAIDEENERPVAFWKPIDEEPFAPNNPRGMQAPFGSETCRPGVKSGESTLREVLAYLLDHDGFAGVPPTALVEVSHPSLKTIPFSVDQVTSKEFQNLISGLLVFKKHQRNYSNVITTKVKKDSPANSTHKSHFSATTSSSTNDADCSDPESNINSMTSRQGKLGSL